MAEPVSKARLRTIVGAVVLLASGVVPWAAAEVLPDPTRPANAARLTQDAEAGAPVLQSILLSSGRKVAIINGQQLPLGASFGGAKIVKITDSEVTLQRGGNRQVLKLFQGLEKSMISGADGVPTNIRRQ